MTRRRSTAGVAMAAGLVRLAVRARLTRPEPLPPPPAGSRTVLTSDGARLHVQVGGRTDAEVTMVLVHGFLARTLEFDSQWQHFSDRVRLVRYDHRHHGRSTGTAGSTDLSGLAADLREVLEQVGGSGPIVLVGHSMGGMVSMLLALEHPDLFDDRVAGVALLSTGAGHYLTDHPVERAVRWASRRNLLAPLLLVLRLGAPALERLRPRGTRTMRGVVRRVVFGSTDVDPSTLAMTQDLLEGPPLTTLAALQGSLLRHDALAALPRLRDVPVLVLTGADDRLVRPEHSRRIAEAIGASAELVVLAGAGHVVNQTRPSETNAALDALLRRVLARRARDAAVA